MKKAVLSLAIFTFTVASAASNMFHFTLSEPASVNATQLKPADYKIQMEGDKAIFTTGKTVIEVPAKMETSDRKFDSTQVDIDTASGQPKLREIRIGGTKTRIVFPNASTPTGY
jgi:hypothetical protein